MWYNVREFKKEPRRRAGGVPNSLVVPGDDGVCSKFQMFLTGAASVFDLEQTSARERMRGAVMELYDPETNKVRISKAASPSGAFMSAGAHLRHAMRQYERQS
jgi:hypothetical protein